MNMDKFLDSIKWLECVQAHHLKELSKEKLFENPIKNCNRCKDFDDDCWGIVDKMDCFLYDPEQGNCPFLTGELKDETIK